MKMPLMSSRVLCSSKVRYPGYQERKNLQPGPSLRENNNATRVTASVEEIAAEFVGVQRKARLLLSSRLRGSGCGPPLCVTPNLAFRIPLQRNETSPSMPPSTAERIGTSLLFDIL